MSFWDQMPDDPNTIHARPPGTMPLDDSAFQETRIVQRADDGGLAALLTAVSAVGGRDEDYLMQRARQIGHELGREGFYSWKVNEGRDNESEVEGATISLVYSLAQAWGRNVTRCRIDNVSGQKVYLTGVYIDLETLTVCERPYIFSMSKAPGKMAKNIEGRNRWEAMQLSAGASKAVRGAILGGLPKAYTLAGMRAAQEADRAELTGKDGKLQEGRLKAINYLSQWDLTAEELVDWLGVPIAEWKITELDALRTLAKRLKNGDTTVDVVRSEVATRRAAASKPEPSKKPAETKTPTEGSSKPDKAPGDKEASQDAEGSSAPADPESGGKDEVLKAKRKLAEEITELETRLGSTYWKPARGDAKVSYSSTPNAKHKLEKLKAWRDQLLHQADVRGALIQDLEESVGEERVKAARDDLGIEDPYTAAPANFEGYVDALKGETGGEGGQ